jgi:acetylornithine aminotransferase
LVAAIAAQAGRMLHTSNLYRIAEQEQLADKLCALSGMAEVFFGNSGAEANEAAIKLARFYGHKKNVELPTVIVMEKAFHGRTMATLSATGNRKAQAGFEPLVSGFVRVPYGDIEAIKAVAEHNKNIVAVMLEIIQGEGGIHLADPAYYRGIRELCDAHDWLMICDEVSAAWVVLASGLVTSRRVSSRISPPWPRAWVPACRSVPAWPAARLPACSARATMARLLAVTPWRQRRR